ncbi:MAG: aminopeptidase, partial [Erysipelotrichaceae bacterium]|nr:aminopeptidase [Erysipelotrichaceae bacterium]
GWLAIYAEDPENLKGVDPDRIRRAQVTQGKALEKFRQREMRNEFPWCVVSVPTAVWAKAVFPEMDTEDAIRQNYPELDIIVKQPDVFYITSKELYEMYPDLSSKEREDRIVKEKKTVFIMQIGDKLPDGKPHDGRAPDYDDWQLNGDLLIWYDVLNTAVELSSMGIRVNKDSLVDQLQKSGKMERMELPYHKALMNDELPLTMGGGIGQSRLCMLLLNKAHVGEVQASVWPDNMIMECHKKNIELL